MLFLYFLFGTRVFPLKVSYFLGAGIQPAYLLVWVGRGSNRLCCRRVNFTVIANEVVQFKGPLACLVIPKAAPAALCIPEEAYRGLVVYGRRHLFFGMKSRNVIQFKLVGVIVCQRFCLASADHKG